MDNAELEPVFESPVLARLVNRISEGIIEMSEAAEGAALAPLAGNEFGSRAMDRAMGGELIGLISGAAWNLAGDWNGKFSPVMAAALSVPYYADLSDTEEEKAHADALEKLRRELQGCPLVSESLARDLAGAVFELVELSSPGLAENIAARHALLGAACVGAAYTNAEQGPANSLKALFRNFGKAGANVTHAPTRALKAWALAKAETMKGADRAIARELADLLPHEFIGKSDDPARLIYDALRARKRAASRLS